MIMMIVMPNLAIRFSCCTSTNDAVESRPEVGSSKNNMVGHAASSRPTLTRFLWPPLKPSPLSTRFPTIIFCFGSSCSACITSSVIFRILALLVPLGMRFLAEKLMFSRTVSPSWTTSSWGTKPITGFKDSMLCFVPFTSKSLLTVHFPSVFFFPVKTSIKVVLPLPEGPMIADKCPASKNPLRSSKTVTTPASDFTEHWMSWNSKVAV
mmetsp:Transcript_24059/g.52372  ORF Transcript_24059/g.52372 Transcript_24059/m.52372 type:complete len:209 (+) Transcript_24059:1693-2319(+)